MEKIKIDIWSDVVCPFCYIGKRRLDKALAQFEFKDSVEIQWHSYQLDPNTPDSGLSVFEYLAQRKGISTEQAQEMHDHVSSMASQEGLYYRFDLAKVANTFKAHRVLKLAGTKGLDHALEEELFKSYFIEGEFIASDEVLLNKAVKVGLNAEEVQEVLDSNTFEQEVRADFHQAQAIGVQGVPFFVFNNKYAISGAQSTAMFQSAFERLAKELDLATANSGDQCDINGENC